MRDICNTHIHAAFNFTVFPKLYLLHYAPKLKTYTNTVIDVKIKNQKLFMW